MIVLYGCLLLTGGFFLGFAVRKRYERWMVDREWARIERRTAEAERPRVLYVVRTKHRENDLDAH